MNENCQQHLVSLFHKTCLFIGHVSLIEHRQLSRFYIVLQSNMLCLILTAYNNVSPRANSLINQHYD